MRNNDKKYIFHIMSISHKDVKTKLSKIIITHKLVLKKEIIYPSSLPIATCENSGRQEISL